MKTFLPKQSRLAGAAIWLCAAALFIDAANLTDVFSVIVIHADEDDLASQEAAIECQGDDGQTSANTPVSVADESGMHQKAKPVILDQDSPSLSAQQSVALQNIVTHSSSATQSIHSLFDKEFLYLWNCTFLI